MRSAQGAEVTERSARHATFVIERSYPAQPAKVFGAWADPAAREIWMADPDYKSDGSKYELDFRVGGHERSSGLTPEGGTFRLEGLIYDIVPDQRIVYCYEMYAGQDRGSVSLATVEIVAEGSGTKLTYTEQGVFLDNIEKPELRQELGWMLDNLGKYLASQAGN
jgi:uncharacterized protein YndB with AHSA1/START domain